ncbi:hypothetical protein SUDANB145_07332 (plasmid) [Streptomyces sp. enrichment culture]|uniref:N-acetylmuramoyl-L-alanine amidase n=1 Tax=Streptomyces sp. enrichment culture TaxID=1795815 RepID=UPI003F54EE9C
MAAPLTADRFVTALKAEGVRVVERSGWRSHNRNSKGAWSNLNGIVIHHTAGTNSLNLCWSGTSDLPGPLCHTHLAKDGTATMVGYGRANHAGTFATNAFNAMLNESSTHPRPDASEPVDANARTYGIEIENLGNGRDPYPEVQYQAAVRWAAALCRAHGWSANSVIGHKEGTRRKIDPSFDMDAFRDAVAARLAHDAGWNPGTSTPSQEDDMALSDADIDKVAKRVLTIDGVIDNPNPDTAEENPYISLETSVRNNEIVARRTEKKLAALQATVDKLISLVGSDVDTATVVAAVQQAIADAVVKVDVDITGQES